MTANTNNLSEDIRVRVDPTTRAALETIAAREDRSVAAVIRRFIREGVDRDARKEGTDDR